MIFEGAEPEHFRSESAWCKKQPSLAIQFFRGGECMKLNPIESTSQQQLEQNRLTSSGILQLHVVSIPVTHKRASMEPAPGSSSAPECT